MQAARASLNERCMMEPKCEGRSLVARLAKMFSDDNIMSLRYQYSVPPGRGSNVYDLFTYFEEQGTFSPSRPSTIITFLKDVERFDMLGIAEEWLALNGYSKSSEACYAEECIRDALEFLGKMDDKMRDAALSKDLAVVTQEHIPCLQQFLATAKTLVGRCLDTVSMTTSAPIYAGMDACMLACVNCAREVLGKKKKKKKKEQHALLYAGRLLLECTLNSLLTDASWIQARPRQGPGINIISAWDYQSFIFFSSLSFTLLEVMSQDCETYSYVAVRNNHAGM